MNAPLSIDELKPGMVAEYAKRIEGRDIERFAEISGDCNAVNLNEEYARSTRFTGRIAHGMLSASLISAAIATELPGPGTVYLSQSLRFMAPVRPNDFVKARIEVIEVDHPNRQVRLSTRCFVGTQLVIDGEATVLMPERSPDFADALSAPETFSAPLSLAI
jgi:3-hydroxybutyryl-CoA dehydratase